jgi:Ca2+-binding EF-hand superfamily protein
VSKREMWNFLHKQGVEASKEEFISFFNELDDDQTGALSFKQFVTGIQGLRKVRAPRPQAVVLLLPSH